MSLLDECILSTRSVHILVEMNILYYSSIYHFRSLRSSCYLLVEIVEFAWKMIYWQKLSIHHSNDARKSVWRFLAYRGLSSPWMVLNRTSVSIVFLFQRWIFIEIEFSKSHHLCIKSISYSFNNWVLSRLHAHTCRHHRIWSHK